MIYDKTENILFYPQGRANQGYHWDYHKGKQIEAATFSTPFIWFYLKEDSLNNPHRGYHRGPHPDEAYMQCVICYIARSKEKGKQKRIF